MPVRVGFIGAGGIANSHMNMLQAVDDVQIVAVADISQERAESAARRYMAKAYSDYRDMLTSEQMDALYVCIPPFAHDEQELLAISKGIHLFIEKPVAHDLDKARRTRDAILENGIISAVGYLWRYLNNIDHAKKTLEGKKIGMVQGYWMSGLPELSWWRKMGLSGGQMVEQTTHIFDLARYFCGDVKEVYAVYGRQALPNVPDFDIYDVGTATLKFANGVVGTISNTCILSVPYTVGLHIIAQDVVLEIHGDLKVIEPAHIEIFSGGENSMLAENRVFIEAIRTGKIDNIRSDYQDAVKTLAVTLACNESANTGLPVEVKD